MTAHPLEQLARDLQEQNNELARDRDLADREVRRLRKEADLLRRQLMEAREADPKSKQIREVLDYWLDKLDKRCDVTEKTPAGGARWQKVKGRLKDGFTVDQLKRAMDGLAAKPYVGPKGRAATGVKSQRYDDVKIPLEDESSVKRFIGYADEAEKPERHLTLAAPSVKPSVDIELVHWQLVRVANRRRLLAVLRGMFGHGLEVENEALLFPCPRCMNDPATTLRLVDVHAGPICWCFACGLDDRQMLRTLAAREGARGVRVEEAA